MRVSIAGWKPEEYGGYAKGNTEVSFDGETLEVVESVSGYEGYTSRTYVPLDLLRTILVEQGMYIVKGE